jgi:phasin family protein
MPTNDDKFSELHRKNMEAAMRLAKASIDNTQRVIALQSELAKSLYDAGISTAKAQAKAKSPKEVLRLQTEYARETTQRVVAMAGELADIANTARSDFSQVLAEQLVSGKEDLTEGLQSIMAKLPNRIPSLSAAIEQAMATANAAFEQIGKVSAAAMGRKRKPKESK